jgi:hypothetical protein
MKNFFIENKKAIYGGMTLSRKVCKVKITGVGLF